MKGLSMHLLSVLILGLFMTAASSVHAAADSLVKYTEQCEQATGIKVRGFSCDDGTKVPTTVDGKTSTATYRPASDCDRPNVLNHECDPGSRFQVLDKTNDAVVVAHCRKQGLRNGEYGEYGDIAVIQHNNKNGATCFYQALADWEDDNTREKAKKPLKGLDVKAPSMGTAAWPWLSPAQTAAIGCGGCHDNGPLIRSPYLTQITEKTDPPKKNVIPGAGDFFNSSGNPYYFVGEEFSPWKAYEVQVKDNICNACHRMGVSNVKAFGTLDGGTARDLGLIATAASQTHKRPHGVHSPLWMIRNIMSSPETFTTAYSKSNEDAAKAIEKCAKRVKESPLPGKDDCTIRQFASRWKLTAVRWQKAQAYFFKGDRYSAFDAKADNTKSGNPRSIQPDWPLSWEGGIDAAILWNEGTAYFFKGREYLKYDVTGKKVLGSPRSIKDHWPGVWADGVDAAVPWNNGKVYFFKGSEYIQYDVKDDKVDPGYPKPIKGNWPDLWEDRVDSAILWDQEDAYFFKDLEYIKYNLKTKKAYPGYPRPINGTWSDVRWEKG
jgi:hypothetical protein